MVSSLPSLSEWADDAQAVEKIKKGKQSAFQKVSGFDPLFRHVKIIKARSLLKIKVYMQHPAIFFWFSIS